MFEFEIGDKVELLLSGERGLVTARAGYIDGSQQYRVDYLCNSGNTLKVDWFGSRSLVKLD